MPTDLVREDSRELHQIEHNGNTVQLKPDVIYTSLVL